MSLHCLAAPAAHLQVILQPLLVQKLPFPRHQVNLRANLQEMLFRQQIRHSHERILAIYNSNKSKSPVSGPRPNLFGTS